MTSSDLFISVAESHVIFWPMSQFGCVVALACSASGSLAAISRICSSSKSRKAPPEAVRIIRRRPPSGMPWMHWKSAECSLSAGRILTPCFWMSGTMWGPPAISVSLFASAMSLPALMASTVGCRPAQPTMPVTTVLHSEWRATSMAPSSPHMISGASEPMSPSSRLKSSTRSAEPTLTSLGLKARVCSARSATLRPALSALTSNLSGCSAQMSSVCVPMDPVDPSSEMVFL
mmetsp:Transcript_210/g.921  ORF Transcript_210/g.921 Transcript_210/m.921 type:complete len:232 (-) Transcript_210:136-831(-)